MSDTLLPWFTNCVEASSTLGIGMLRSRSSNAPAEPSLRRGLPPRPRNVVVTVFERDDGVVDFIEGVSPSAPVRRMSSERPSAPARVKVAGQISFEKLPPNRLWMALIGLDRHFLARGQVGDRAVAILRDVDGDEVREPPREGRVLLFVHGTASNTEHLLSDLRATPDGRHLLQQAGRQYDAVLAYDHATLSVSPLLNAIDLRRSFAASEAVVDVVCHSRGGLVTRWWREVLDDDREGRTVFVGTTIGGTSLASPAMLRAAIRRFLNLSRCLSLVADLAAQALPLFQLAAGLMQVLSSVASIGSRTPLIDAGLAVVPGLAAQGREGANPELLRLREAAPEHDRYFAVTSDFQPASDSPFWKLWEHLRRERVLHAAVQSVIGDAHDLVVDTEAMVELSDTTRIPAARTLSLQGGVVIHTNYFRQPEVARFLLSSLRL